MLSLQAFRAGSPPPLQSGHGSARLLVATPVRLLPGPRRLALRLLSGQDPPSGGAALPALWRRRRIPALSVPEPAPPPGPAAGGGGLRRPAGTSGPPLQVRGLAGPGATTGTLPAGSAGRRWRAGRHPGARPAAPRPPPRPWLQPIRADRARARSLAPSAAGRRPRAPPRHSVPGWSRSASTPRERRSSIWLARWPARRRPRPAGR